MLRFNENGMFIDACDLIAFQVPAQCLHDILYTDNKWANHAGDLVLDSVFKMCTHKHKYFQLNNLIMSIFTVHHMQNHVGRQRIQNRHVYQSTVDDASGMDEANLMVTMEICRIFDLRMVCIQWSKRMRYANEYIVRQMGQGGCLVYVAEIKVVEQQKWSIAHCLQRRR